MAQITHFPRLDSGRADEARRRFVRRDIEVIEFDEVALDEALQDSRAFPPTGGARITSSGLLHLRQRLMTASAPTGTGASPELYASFDLVIGRELDHAGRDTHGDFGDPRVWDFLTLVLVPDLAARRLGTMVAPQNENTSVLKRLTGGDRRHVFQKLWKRWRVFGAEIVESGRLTEDDYVATLERRITLERGQLARCVANAIIGSGYAGSSRRLYTRVFMRNLQQVSGLVQIPDDDANYVRAIVDNVHEQTVRALE